MTNLLAPSASAGSSAPSRAPGSPLAWARPVGRPLRDAPRAVRVTLLGILAAAALLYTWNIGHSGLSTYYAAAAKSMAADPRALFFGALDPSALTTLDKLSGFLVPQALAIRLFGFHAWALSLPQAVEGLVTVYAGYAIGARWRGFGYGLAIAGLLTFTPMLAAMFGRPMEDGMLTMCQVLAFAAAQRAVISQRMPWLLVSAAWVAVGFQAKMLQSWLILPALAIVWLLGGRGTRRARIRQTAIAGVACLLLSVSWMTAIQLVPASSRPYIDGTTDDSTYSMVFGYNGVDRLVPGLIPGAVPQLNRSPGSGQSAGASPAQQLPNRTATASAGESRAKLLLPQFTTQIGWLYPLAAVGIAATGMTWWRRRRPDPAALRPAALHPVAPDADPAFPPTAVGLLAWLAVTAAVLSLAFVPHATYFAVIALPLAALAVLGADTALRAYREPVGRGWVLLPALVLAQAVWVAVVALGAAPSLRCLAPIAVVLGAIAAVALVHHRRRKPGSRRLLRIGLATATAAALVAPLTWSLCVLGPGGGGSASDAFAGPRLTATAAAMRQATARHRAVVGRTSGAAAASLRAPFTGAPDPALSPVDARLVHYVDARNAPGAIAFASDSMPVAVAVILATRDSPMPMGGFSRQAPDPSLARLRELIGTRRLRFVLLQDDPSAAGPAPANPVLDADRTWVRSSCRPALSGAFRDRSRLHQTLYDCAPA